MNIGEISKPSIERANIQPKVPQSHTEPVTESRKIVDTVQLSKESRQRSKGKKHKNQASADEDLVLQNSQNKSHTSAIKTRKSKIDFTV